MKRLLVLSVASLALGACGLSHPMCSAIKVGDTVELKTCESSWNRGSDLAGTCDPNSTAWQCAAISTTFDSHASACQGLFQCFVQLDADGRVACVRDTCQD